MDNLLQELRQNMAELSVQGDDFTRQIWQMYATFEEFIDHQQSSGEGDTLKHSSSDTVENIPPPPAPSGGIGTSKRINATKKLSNLSNMSENLQTNSTEKYNRSVSPPKSVSDDIALPSPRRPRRRRPRRLRRSFDNPILETISAIGDSDDEVNLFHHKSYTYRLNTYSPASCPRLHSETDLIGYAGCNSIDSGYKSACPTPDLVDWLYPEHKLEQKGSLASLASSGSSGGSNTGSKPRIPMGTRVMSRGGARARSPVRSGGLTPTRKIDADSMFYEIDQFSALCQAYLNSPTEINDCITTGSNRNKVTSYKMTDDDSKDNLLSPERRLRSASIGSESPPTSKSFRKKCFASNVNQMALPTRRTSLSPSNRDDLKPPNAWSRHSSPGLCHATRMRRPPSPIIGVDHLQGIDHYILKKESDLPAYAKKERFTTSYYNSENMFRDTSSFSESKEHSYQRNGSTMRNIREIPLEEQTSWSVNEKTPKENLKTSTKASVTSDKKLYKYQGKMKMLTSFKKHLQSNQTPENDSGQIISSSGSDVSYNTFDTFEGASDKTVVQKNCFASNSYTKSNENISTRGGEKNSYGCNESLPIIINKYVKDYNTKNPSIREMNPCNGSSFDKLFQYNNSTISSKAIDLLGVEVLEEIKTPIRDKYLKNIFNSDKNSKTIKKEPAELSSNDHLYEEIVYGSSSKSLKFSSQNSSPPPLPRRPSFIFKKKNMVKFDRLSECCNCCPCKYVSSTQNNLFTIDVNYENCDTRQLSFTDSTTEKSKNTITTNQSIENFKNMITTNRSVLHPNSFDSARFLENDYTSKLKISHNHKPKPVPLPRKILLSTCFENQMIEDDQTKDIGSKLVAYNITEPKQRNNLYSIFKDKIHRKCLSASLELEYNQPKIRKDIENNNQVPESKNSREFNVKFPNQQTIISNNTQDGNINNSNDCNHISDLKIKIDSPIECHFNNSYTFASANLNKKPFETVSVQKPCVHFDIPKLLSRG